MRLISWTLRSGSEHLGIIWNVLYTWIFCEKFRDHHTSHITGQKYYIGNICGDSVSFFENYASHVIPTRTEPPAYGVV